MRHTLLLLGRGGRPRFPLFAVRRVRAGKRLVQFARHRQPIPPPARKVSAKGEDMAKMIWQK
jgi:hypothetical protein